MTNVAGQMYDENKSFWKGIWMGALLGLWITLLAQAIVDRYWKQDATKYPVVEKISHKPQAKLLYRLDTELKVLQDGDKIIYMFTDE